MANVLTRINNNQISSAVGGNAALGINAASKVQAYSITSTLLANSLVYGSDLTISGNLTVNGTTTAVDTVNTLIKDPIITLADGQTSGTPTVDIGMLGLRGNQNSSFMGWLESPQTFAVLLTNTVSSNTTVNATSYGNFIASNITANANLSVVGNIVGTANFSGNLAAGNISTPGLFSATGNVTAGNITTAGVVTSTGNITGGNLLTAGLISATGNITGNNINAINGFFGNLNLTGDITVNSLSSNTFISATGNVIANNVNTDNVYSSAELTLTAASGDIILTSSGNINVSNEYINNLRDPVQAQDAATKQYVDDQVSAGLTIHTPVYVETPVALPSATYAQGGNVFTVNQTIAGNTVVFTTAANLQVNDQLWFGSSFQGILGNTAYFVVSTPNTSAAVLSTTYNGAPVSNITSATGLSQSVRVNSGIGATLTATANGALTIDSVSVSNTQRVLVYQQANAAQNGVYVVSNAGNSTSAWVLTRSTDTDVYGPKSTDELDVGDYFYVQAGASGAGESYVMTAPSTPFIIGYDNLTFTQFSASQVYSANTNAGLSLVGTVFSAKVDNNTTAFDGGGNISVKPSANLTTPNIGNATGNSLTLTGNGLLQSTTVSATGDITADGNITSTGGNLVAVLGNVYGANLETTGVVAASGNVIGGNIRTSGLITATGNITGSNLILTNGFIDGPASGRITINGSDLDTDFAVDGDTLANVFYVDAGTGTVSFGSSAQVTNAIATFNTTTSIKVPTGTTGERPGTGVTGMVRFNTSNNNLEIFDNAAWTAVGVPVFTVIADEQFNGDGANTVFTLTNGNQTTNSCIVSINGVIQIPNLAYGVSGAGGNVLTFTEAPAVGDIIDVRQVTTTTTVTSISNSSGNAVVAVSPTANDVQITGDLVPTGNLTANLGSSTNLWNSLYVGGNTIYLGNLQLKEVSANTFGVFTSDGTTQANVDVGNIDVSSIVSGTSTIGIAAPNGNAFITVGGTANIFRATTTGILVTGTISANGNVDGGNFRTGGLVSATGNVDGANFMTAGLVSATGNIRGANFNTAGLISATGAITGASLTVGGGNITAGNLLLTGAIEDSAQLDIRTTASNANIVLTPNGTGNVNISGNVMPTANATANIGSATLSFNTIFAKATSAQYADLAEKYTADAEYAPGTVVMFGGSAEVTVCANDACKRVAGVISTNPSYIMNGGLEAEHVATVALTGRVPCLVTGTVRKGDLMVSAGNGRARAEENPQVGTVIGKALADSDGDTVIEVVVGRF